MPGARISQTASHSLRAVSATAARSAGILSVVSTDIDLLQVVCYPEVQTPVCAASLGGAGGGPLFDPVIERCRLRDGVWRDSACPGAGQCPEPAGNTV